MMEEKVELALSEAKRILKDEKGEGVTVGCRIIVAAFYAAANAVVCMKEERDPAAFLGQLVAAEKLYSQTVSAVLEALNSANVKDYNTLVDKTMEILKSKILKSIKE